MLVILGFSLYYWRVFSSDSSLKWWVSLELQPDNSQSEPKQAPNNPASGKLVSRILISGTRCFWLWPKPGLNSFQFQSRSSVVRLFAGGDGIDRKTGSIRKADRWPHGRSWTTLIDLSVCRESPGSPPWFTHPGYYTLPSSICTWEAELIRVTDPATAELVMHRKGAAS